MPEVRLAAILVLAVVLILVDVLVLILIRILILILIVHGIVPPISFSRLCRYYSMPVISGFILWLKQNTGD